MKTDGPFFTKEQQLYELLQCNHNMQMICIGGLHLVADKNYRALGGRTAAVTCRRDKNLVIYPDSEDVATCFANNKNSIEFIRSF